MSVAGAPDSLAAWHAWVHVTPVAQTVARNELVRVSLPPLRIAPDAAGGYPDMRVIDSEGREVPFALDPQTAPAAARALSLIDTGFVVGEGSRAVIDLGAGWHLDRGVSLAIDTDALPTYFEHVALDASDDRITWRRIVDDAVVYRVAANGGDGNTTVSFPATSSRWLRVRVLDPHLRVPFTGATLDAVAPAAPLVALALASDERIVNRHQIYTFVAPVAVRPVALEFDDARGRFSRAFGYETSIDGKHWYASDEGVVERFADGTSHVSFALPESSQRYVRAIVDDGDDAPVALRPVLFVRAHDVVFAARAHERYRLLSDRTGPDAAGAPTYDLGDLLSHSRWTARPLTLEETTANSGFEPGVRHADLGRLVDPAIGVAAVLLAVLAFATIKSAGPMTSEDT